MANGFEVVRKEFGQAELVVDRDEHDSIEVDPPHLLLSMTAIRHLDFPPL